jgi:membrane-associated phospholipid phosphatase
MRWHKFLSTILHPIVMPTIGLLLYFYFYPFQVSLREQLYFLSIVFIATYVIPVFILIVLKLTKNITSINLPSIKERKVPLFIMMCVFLVLARYFSNFRNAQDLAYLFYGTLLGLICIYLIFVTGVKTSIHLLSMGSAIGYFIVFQLIYNISMLPLIVILILFSGLLGSSRLYLKAHTPKEVYLGFILGISCQLIAYYML